MASKITKHFVTVGSRRLHYHRSGVGPVLILLHASACSAKVMRSHIEVLSESFTVIAPDTPGFGLSDLLPMAQVTTEDLADALADTLDALGIDQVSVYGRHTGAQIAVEFAARHPDRCAMALTDGFPVYTIEERIKRLAGYLPPIVPEFDGSHLLWIWFRYREQHVFWPWNAQDLAHRADTDVPDLDFLHRGVIELLEAGDGYRIGYATAYRHRGLDVVADLTVPVCFGGRPGDSQGRTPEMMPEGTWTQQLPRDKHEALRVEHQLLRQHPANGTAPEAPACSVLSGRSTTDYLNIDDRMVLVRTIGDLHMAPPVLIIHRLPGSSALYDPLLCAIGKSRPVLALDLPGHGESEALADDEQHVAEWVRSVLSVLDRLSISTCHVYGHNGGATVAVELALRHPKRIVSLLLDSPVCLSLKERDSIGAVWLQGVEPVTPSWDGSHLLRVWHMRRDMALWWPWFEKKREFARQVGPRIDPEELTLELREIMKQPGSFAPAWRLVMDYPMATRLAQAKQPCLLISAKTDVFAPCFQLAASVRSDLLALWVDDDCAARAQAMVEFMGKIE
jgi:pimeloyl-ACP methyl ester carboxylesterase